MAIRAWNTGELKVLRLFAPLGSDAVAQLLERSQSSVQAKAREMGVSLQATGDDMTIDEVAPRILQRLKSSIGLDICPLCGKRLAIMRTTGMCRVCHLDQLITLREVQLLETARERKLTKLRQDKRRLRVCNQCGRPFFPRMGSDAVTCNDCEGVG